MSLGNCIAQLRHLYSQMVGGDVRDPAGAAKGLLGPVIADLERIEAAPAAPTGERERRWYAEDGSVLDLDPREVIRRRKAAAKVVAVARTLSKANGAGVIGPEPFVPGLAALRAALQTLDTCPAAPPTAPARSVFERQPWESLSRVHAPAPSHPEAPADDLAAAPQDIAGLAALLKTGKRAPDLDPDARPEATACPATKKED